MEYDVPYINHSCRMLIQRFGILVSCIQCHVFYSELHNNNDTIYLRMQHRRMHGMGCSTVGYKCKVPCILSM